MKFQGRKENIHKKNDWDINQVTSVIMPHLAKFEKQR